MVPVAVKMTLRMRACHCANEERIADDVVNAAFDKIVGDCQMGGGHKLGVG